MKKLSIDRFEGIYAICEDSEGAKFAIPTAELPKEAKEGVCLAIDDEGNLSIDEEETARRKANNASRQKGLF